MKITETCPCGASIIVDPGAYVPEVAIEQVRDWRTNHQHATPVPVTPWSAVATPEMWETLFRRLSTPKEESPAADRPANWGAFVWAHPGRMSGEPCIGGRRVPVDTIRQMTEEEAIDGYDITAEEYRLACWFGECFTYTYSHDANQRFRTATLKEAG